MLHPVGNSEQVFGFEVSADRELGFLLYSHLLGFVLEQLQRRRTLIAMLLVSLRGDRTRPLLMSHGKQLLWSEGDQRNVLEKENISLAPDCGLR